MEMDVFNYLNTLGKGEILPGSLKLIAEQSQTVKGALYRCNQGLEYFVHNNPVYRGIRSQDRPKEYLYGWSLTLRGTDYDKYSFEPDPLENLMMLSKNISLQIDTIINKTQKI